MAEHDPVNHPKHYTSHQSGVECIQIAEQLNFNMGNAWKYVQRAGMKGERLEDLRKAEFYLNREMGRLGSTPLPSDYAIVQRFLKHEPNPFFRALWDAHSGCRPYRLERLTDALAILRKMIDAELH